MYNMVQLKDNIALACHLHVCLSMLNTVNFIIVIIIFIISIGKNTTKLEGKKQCMQV